MATAVSEAVQSKRSEDILGQKTDLALATLATRTAAGLGIGVLLSAILFKRRTGPIYFLTGAGFGAGYADSQRIFNPAAIPGYKVANLSSQSSSTASSIPNSLSTPSATQAKMV
ncbi:hypothetical protein P389DRAFT_198900 [Cystobasidium minutum MCA 4210]|uniref:uncharacterized protein n=1 Tax=Cystobasidium minutum MCA 4210 TaxID=1397322 RepID=UPI0034CF2758|eukprot:jgi/Rhomi1/198900/gm1.7114_g